MAFKSLAAIFALFAGSIASADTKYYVILIQGTKIGYVSSAERPDTFKGQPAIREESHSLMETVTGGVPSRTDSESITWKDKTGKLLCVKNTDKSGGRTQKVTKTFGAKTVEIDMETGGVKSHRTAAIPIGPIVDDPLDLMKQKLPASGQKLTFWEVDSESGKFEKVELKFIGPSTTEVHGVKISANLMEIASPEMTLKVFATSTGELVRIDGPMGMEILPETKEVALAKPGKDTPKLDLETLGSLKTDKPIADSDHCTELKLRINGSDLSKIPSEGNQAVTKDGDGWIVDIHPSAFVLIPKVSIAEAGIGYEKWLEPSLYMDSKNQTLREVAAKLVGGQNDVRRVTVAIVHYVAGRMKYKDGIDISRDALEIFKTKEGVCRDFAILTTTLLRAAGIPSRVVAGLVYDDGAFYAHAWNEVWDGHRWVGVDSTNNIAELPAEYIKLGQGNVEEAYSANFPYGAKIAVLDVRH